MTMAMAALLCLETAVSASQWPGSVRRSAASGRFLIGILLGILEACLYLAEPLLRRFRQ